MRFGNMVAGRWQLRHFIVSSINRLSLKQPIYGHKRLGYCGVFNNGMRLSKAAKVWYWPCNHLQLGASLPWHSWFTKDRSATQTLHYPMKKKQEEADANHAALLEKIASLERQLQHEELRSVVLVQAGSSP